MRGRTPDVELDYRPLPAEAKTGVEIFAHFEKYSRFDRDVTRRWARLLRLATGKEIRMWEDFEQVDLFPPLRGKKGTTA